MTEILQTSMHPGTAPRAAWTRAAKLGLLLVVAALSGAFAYAFLFTTFRLQDDEGYFLLALRAYRSGLALYDEIDTIYGPFYFQFVDGIFRLLHLSLDNVGARWFVLGIWIVSGWCVFRYVQRVTGSFLAGMLAYCLSFPILSPLVSAPLHPGCLNVLLLAALVLASLDLSDPSKQTRALVLCGALTAALCLSKLNAGIFAAAAFAACVARFAPRTRWRALLRIAVAISLPMFPFLIMNGHFESSYIRGFAWMVSIALVPFGFLAALDSEERPRLRIAPYLGGGIGLTAIVIALCLVNGTSWHGLWQSLVVDTLRFPGAMFLLPPVIEPGLEVAVFLAAIPVLLCARFGWMAWLGAKSRSLFKLVAGLTILALCFASPLNCIRALPLVWLLAVPGAASTRGLETRALLALLVVLESMHAYPVAGNQAVLFAFLLPAAGAVLVCDSYSELPPAWRAVSSRPQWKLAAAVAFLFTLAVFHSVVSAAPILAKQFKKGIALELPGAETLRFTERRAAEFQWVTRNLEQHGDTFVGFPGLHSFYFWSTLVPPVAFYPNTWIRFYDETKQEMLARALLASKRPCIVRDRAMIDFWTGKRDLPDGPLVRAAEREFHVVGAAGDYELLIPNAAHADLVLSILTEPAPRALHEKFKIDRALRLSLPVMKGVHLSRVVVHDTHSGLDLFDSSAASPEQRAAIVNTAGDELLRARSADTIDLSTRADIFMVCPASEYEFTSANTLVRAYDDRGHIVARLLVPTATRTQ